MLEVEQHQLETEFGSLVVILLVQHQPVFQVQHHEVLMFFLSFLSLYFSVDTQYVGPYRLIGGHNRAAFNQYTHYNLLVSVTESAASRRNEYGDQAKI